jgi:hypothetical protein
VDKLLDKLKSVPETPKKEDTSKDLTGKSAQLYRNQTLRHPFSSHNICTILPVDRLGVSPTKALQFFIVIESRTRKFFLQRRDRRREEVFTTFLNDPAVQRHAGLSGILAIRKTDRARRVMLKSLTNNSINARTVTANEIGLAVGEVVIARPAWKSQTSMC